VGGAPGVGRDGGDQAGAELATPRLDREGEDEGDRRRHRRVEVGEDRRVAIRQQPVEGDDAAFEPGRRLFGQDDDAAHAPVADLGRTAGGEGGGGRGGEDADERADRQAAAVEHAGGVDFEGDPPQRRWRPAGAGADVAGDLDADRRRAGAGQGPRRDRPAEGDDQVALAHGLGAGRGGGGEEKERQRQGAERAAPHSKRDCSILQ
jgi:hypothetical protein